MGPIVAHEYEKGFDAGERNAPRREPADCTDRDSWMLGHAYGKAVHDMRNKNALATLALDKAKIYTDA